MIRSWLLLFSFVGLFCKFISIKEFLFIIIVILFYSILLED